MYRCNYPCKETCPPCEKKCAYSCTHSKCPLPCSVPCVPCQVRSMIFFSIYYVYNIPYTHLKQLLLHTMFCFTILHDIQIKYKKINFCYTTFLGIYIFSRITRSWLPSCFLVISCVSYT